MNQHPIPDTSVPGPRSSGLRPVLVWGTAAIATVVVVVTIVAGHGSAHRAASGSPSGSPTGTTPSATAASTSLGAAGVVSSAIVAENSLAGTTDWQIPEGKLPGLIEGFANTTYAKRGDSVGLYVRTNAKTFHVVAYRMGWYGGSGAREVWRSEAITGSAQPTCVFTREINRVSCADWTRSTTVSVTTAFVPGDYLLKLVGDGGQQAYVLLTVWEPGSHAAYVVMARSLTEAGWNAYGGYSFYFGTGPCTLSGAKYPICNRTRVASFDRPFDVGHGSSDFLSNEFPLVQLAEKDGLDVTYATDITVGDHPEMLLSHKALLSLGHDETWTYAERKATEDAFHRGMNIVFFGAASVLRHSRLQSSPLGPEREEVDYRNSQEDPLNGHGDPMQVTGNTWSSPPTLWSGSPLIGESYSGYLAPGAPPADFVVADGSAWLFGNTGLHTGSHVHGVIQSDIDHLDLGIHFAPNLQVLGHSAVPLKYTYTNQGTWGGHTYSDATYYTDAATKAGVFDSGTVAWISALIPCAPSTAACPAAHVAAMTENLLRLFGQGPAGTVQPAVPNWRTIKPPGS